MQVARRLSTVVILAIASFILILCACFLTPAKAYAYDYSTYQDGAWIYYTTSKGTATITAISYSGDTNQYPYKDYAIPTSVGGYYVRGIDSRACFYSNFTSITVPDTVEWIGDYAFSDNSHLRNVYLPSSLESMGDCVFNGCYSLKVYMPATCTVSTDAFKGVSAIVHLYGDDLTQNPSIPSEIQQHFMEYRNQVNSTCSKEGTMAGYYCQDPSCNGRMESYGKPFESYDASIIQKKAHAKTTIKGKKATSTKTGLTDGVKCKVCGKILTAQKVLPKIVPMKFNKSSVTYGNSKKYVYTVTVKKIKGNYELAKAVSSKKSVATVTCSKTYFKVTPKHYGTTTITVTDKSGQTKKIKVTVNKSYFQKWLKAKTKIQFGSVAFYDKGVSTHVRIKSWGDVSYALKIGNKVYKGNTKDSTEDYLNFNKGEGFAPQKYTLKIPWFKRGTKYALTVSRGGCSYTVKGTYNNVLAKRASVLYQDFRQIKVKCYNVNVGDTVTLKMGSKSYRKVISDVYKHNSNITFSLPNTLWNYMSYRLMVTSSDGKKWYDSGTIPFDWS